MKRHQYETAGKSPGLAHAAGLASPAELAEGKPSFSNRANVAKKELFTSKALGLGGKRTYKEIPAKQEPGVSPRSNS